MDIVEGGHSRATDLVALHNLALLYEATGRPALAAALLRHVIDKDPGYLSAKWELALIRLGMGNLSEGFAGYETRVEWFLDLAGQEFAGMRHWAGECVTDKTVLIVNEHGIGDSIVCSRFIPWICSPDIGAKKVWARVTAELISLLWEMRGMVEFLPADVPLPQADYFLFIGSLPHFYDSYAHADPPPPRLRTIADIPPDPGFIRRRVDKEMGEEL
jgi:hypothetical protein